MQKVAMAAGAGVAAGLVVGGTYFGAPYAGLHVDLSLLVAIAAILAFGSSVAVFTLLAFSRQVGGRAHASTRLNELPVSQFVAPFKEAGAIQILAQPGIPVDVTLMRHGRVFESPAEHADRKITLTIKKAKKGGEVFNPVVLKELFERLKPFTTSRHILLVNEHGEFMGYIPWTRAIKDFTGENAETKIRKSIVDVLDDPAKSTSLRAMDGMATDDIISDGATIHDAAKMTWFDDPLHGLVVYHGKRNRKPIGVINKNDLLQLISTGA